MSKVYILHLMCDLSSNPGAMSYGVLGVSTDLDKIMDLQVEEQGKLNEELGVDEDEDDNEDEDEDDFDFDGDFRGYSLTCPPYLLIEEKELI